MHDLNDLYYFVKVVEHRGFAAAGRALGVAKSKLSRRIALLEERLATRLLQRSTRHFEVTEIGQMYYVHCKGMLEQAEAAEEVIAMTHAEPRGIVRMTCPIGLLDGRVSDMVATFMARHPLVHIHLEETNRRVDVLSEGIDIAIRVRPPPLEDSDLVMRIYSDRGQSLVASPALLERLGTPTIPADLSRFPSLHMGIPQNDHVWSLWGPNGAHAAIRHQPRLITRSMPTLRSAAEAGVGIVQLPVMMMPEQLASGTLVCVLPEWQPKREIVHAVFASRRGLLPSVRFLIDFLGERFKALEED